ncbi:DUF4352 domain-containing protein [Domibacillus sp. A3M-37]|uniref:DUF4352 domain-containing protein n=1 Tax=Domibacillus sp. A3M-37 TaxID=2962037 RepID=UPI0020B79EC8|nr:DUF4352 domain-containing protein [Domibacillus sp. A3M-37]MCP3763858.1 DUF4352 domain-containing protein [Domibacillus sp. A3M-37]
MGKFFKIGCLGIIGIFVLPVIIGMFASDDTSTQPTTETSEPATEKTTAAPEPEEEPAEEPAESTPGLGETVEVETMTFTINEKSSAAQVGPSSLPERATGKYVVLDVTVLNKSNDAVTIDSSYFKLKQGEKTFEADSMASMSANQNEDGSIPNSLFFEQLNLGSELSGKIVFDVAADVADATDLQVQVQDGVFGTNTQLINLQ